MYKLTLIILRGKGQRAIMPLAVNSWGIQLFTGPAAEDRTCDYNFEAIN